jgi:hypothetical protein
MRLLGANAHAQAEGIGLLPGKTNYFLGADRAQWHTGVPNYAQVRFHDVYPGIDLLYYGNQRQLEYDFVVSPAGNPSAIRLQFGGQDSVKVDLDGDLVVTIFGEDMRFRKPAVYQPAEVSEGLPDKHGRRVVQGAWRIEGNDSARFEIGSYDAHQPLVIDPVLVYSTYLGGSSPTGGYAIALDSSGSVYVTGSTNSTDFPVSSGAFQKTYGGNSIACESINDCGDVFVTKLDPTGTTIVYSTYLGGSNDETGLGIAIDAAGDAYITGFTSSLNFPTTPGAFQTTCNGCAPFATNAFVTKLNPSGSALVYSTFLGGSANNRASSIAVDSSGNAYIAGWTASPDFPVTAGAFQTSITSDDSDAFVSKLNPAGSALVYSTYLGGGSAMSAGAVGIALDGEGSAYVTGTTNSSSFPTTSGAFQIPFGLSATPAYMSSSSYVTKLNSAGSGLIYSSLFSGPSSAIVVDSLGSAYVTGSSGQFFPTTPGAINDTCDSGSFLSKFTPDGSNLVFSDYFCSEANSLPSAYGFSFGPPGALALDSSGNIYLGGTTGSTGFPTTAGAFQTQLANVCCFFDGFLMKVIPGGSALAYSTFLGGSSTDSVSGVSVDASGNAYLTGYTESPDFPTQNPIQGSLSGAFDAFITEISTSAGPLSAWPAVVNFGDQGVGINSSPLPVTVANASNSAIEISGIVAAGNFTQTNNCPASLAPSGRCTVSVVFNPQAAGTISGTLTITAGGSGSPPSIQLEGNGVNGPVAVLSQTTAYWASQPVGFTSPPLTITLTNTGNSELDVSSVTLNPYGVFGFGDDNCGAVQPQTSCTVQVTFTPGSVGENPTSSGITFQDNAGTGSQGVELIGVGVADVVTFSSPGLKFADQPVGTAGGSQPVFLVNGLPTPITLNSITTSSDFSQLNTCGATLASGAYCSLNVTFNPTTNGIRLGTLTVNDSGAGSPQVMYLLGAGVGPEVGLSVSGLTFENEMIGTTSSSLSVTLTNTGATVLAVNGITASGDFAQTNTCGASVAAGGNCTINVTFTPTAEGNRSGMLTITDNSNGVAGSTQTVTLSGTGLAPLVALSPTSLTFSGQVSGTASSAQAVKLTNSGNATLTLSSIAVSGDFAQTNNCGASLAASATCTINVTFTPTAGGSRTGSITLTDNAGNSPQTVALTGTGEDFTLSMPSGSSSTASVSPGQAASYSLNMGGLGGLNQAINFTCTGAPSESTCTVSPSSATPSASGSVAVTVAVTTTAPGAVAPRPRPTPPFGPGTDLRLISFLLLGLLTLAWWASVGRRPRGKKLRWGLGMAAVATLALAMASCGGGGGGGGVPPNPGTPAGSYTLTVTGALSGSALQHSITLTLKVS